jgi:hypothetical protein
VNIEPVKKVPGKKLPGSFSYRGENELGALVPPDLRATVADVLGDKRACSK